MVHIILCTRGGVREAHVVLDFLTGKVRNERRNLFRYDAVASVHVRENGLRRLTDGKLMTEAIRLRSRTLSINLVNGREISTVTEHANTGADPVVDEEWDLSYLQTSGIDSALPILEAVAAEGSGWIDRELERRERWSNDWYEWTDAPA